ncbi:hypothetical protein A7A08_00059 [Methyloligella halotolerans]|uniref:Tat pathway signal sequence domain protein n=1 Tax=Methyloligella halotolerans TaxID=1177755 RepID=A0A1E2S1E4_9HYPH|nr:hypothetical protein [Methyloligella halotolerans]ODA68242.1 hypothetical protein A7A08_00059 [Methyloligella halotolerans]
MKFVPAALLTVLIALGGIFAHPAGVYAQESDPAAPAGEPAADEAGKLSMELNKLETQGNACRTYLVFKNETGSSFKTLKLDLVVFGADGIVSKRLAVEAAPLAADKTSLKVFDIGDVTCDKVGQLLLNDVTACADENGEIDECIAKLDLKSRGDVEFTK